MTDASPSLATRGLGLLLAVGTHKAGVLFYGFCLGRWGGTAPLGVMAVVLAWGWVLGTFAGAGLPDRVLVEAATRGSTREGHRGAQGTFLLLQASATGLLWLVAPWLATPDLSAFARMLALGAGLQGFGAVVFSARRGRAMPRAEVWSTAAAGLVLVLAGMEAGDAQAFGLVWLAAGACFALGAAVVAMGDLRLWPSLESAGREMRQGLPYLAAGLGSFLLGNGDLLAGRFFLGSAAALGELQVGTLLVRSAATAPWILATLALHRWEAEGRSPWFRQAGIGLLFSLPIVMLGRMLVPLVGWGFALDPEVFSDEMHLSLALSPLLFALLSVVPASMAQQLGRCVWGTWLGVLVFLGLALSLAPGTGNLLICLAVGQGVSLGVLLWPDRRAPVP